MGTPNKSLSWPAVQKIFCTKTVCKQFICVLCPLALWECVWWWCYSLSLTFCVTSCIVSL